ncbi:restriction endonuclease subunit S [Nocardia grenadensis]|uniref:restriction endonuclease subunit S n=1 Tax=Nocardia grenadensis TaxID=931537 RepID=UPI0009FEB74B|nr:restriction endonuclease subunit S [Nocardia grenadensis]
MTHMRPLFEICTLITDGTHYTPPDLETGIPFLTVKDMHGRRLDFTGCSHISEAEYHRAAAGNSTPRKYDVLFSKDGTVGKVHVVDSDRSFAVLSSIAILRPDSRRVISQYLGWALRSPEVLSDAIRKKSGSAIRRIILSDLKSIKIPLPSIQEQQRIAQVLDRLDALREKRRKSIAILDGLAQSIFLDMFGDPAANQRQWKVIPLGDAMESRPQNGLYKPSSDYGSGAPIVRIDAFYDGVISGLPNLKRVMVNESDISKYGLKPNDILINRVNSLSHLGKSALVPPLQEPTVFESNMMRFKFDEMTLNAVYAINSLQTAHIKSQILRAAKKSINQASINQTDVTNLQILAPPIQLQEEFASRVQAIERTKPRLMAHLAGLDTLFTSVQTRAFRGELWQDDLKDM